jgi:hypothetical protein
MHFKIHVKKPEIREKQKTGNNTNQLVFKKGAKLPIVESFQGPFCRQPNRVEGYWLTP